MPDGRGETFEKYHSTPNGLIPDSAVKMATVVLPWCKEPMGGVVGVGE